MRDTIIVDTQGYLGPYLPCLLEVGQTQSVVFNADDCGPWTLSSAEQRDLQRHSKASGRSKLVERSKKQLFKVLTDACISFQQYRNHTKKELQDFARTHAVALPVQKELVTQGWEGQPKGLQQVLWERGFISQASLEKYTLDGCKDPISGQIDYSFCFDIYYWSARTSEKRRHPCSIWGGSSWVLQFSSLRNFMLNLLAQE